MDPSSHPQVSPEKIYKENFIWAGTFLGGPLAAGYFIAENYKAFGQPENARKTWIYAIVVSIIIFGSVIMIPESVKIPNQVIPLIYTLITMYLVKHFQGNDISAHLALGGQAFGWGRAIIISLISAAVTFGLLFGYLLLAGDAGDAESVTKTFGKMNHEIAYENDNLTIAEVDKLGDALTTTTFFDDNVTKYVFAKKVDKGYEISISVIKGAGSDPEAVAYFTQLKDDLQTLYPDNRIALILVVDNLDNVVKRIE